MLESVPVHPTGASFARAIRVYDPRARAGLRRVADSVHAGGATVVGQLWHCGRQGSSAITGMPLWAPSATPCPVSREIPRAMTLDEIRELVEAFAAAAHEFQAAGFDGVELAAGHGYLVHQFLSPLSNLRTDAYGGTPEARARFFEEVLDEIRSSCGRDLVLGVRLSADEFLSGGFGLGDCLPLVRRLARRGDVDYLSISGGTHASVEQMVGDWSVPRGNLVPLAHAVRREAGGVPVLACGRIVDPDQAEEILRAGEADLIGMARALIADPRWADKAARDRPLSIRPCIACNECEARIFQGLPIACAVQPVLAADGDALRRARSARKVIVVGGGPAGMEAARVAALRGHRVVLYEREVSLGGQLRLLRALRTREEFDRIVAFLERELVRLGVEVRLGHDADADAVAHARADAIVVATGSVSDVPRLGSAERPRVVVPEGLATGTAESLGSRVVVWDGGGSHDRLLAVAEAMLADGREVYVVTPAPALGADVSFISLAGILRRLRAGRARLLTLTDVRRVTNGCLELQECPDGPVSVLQGVDALVIVTRTCPQTTLLDELDGNTPHLLAAGDCVAPRGLHDAFREGRAAGLAV